ncbi:hypothetical protein [Streptomyces prasinopilosus]|uniref:hypothetical protein n=1 Tax=Streptomyces prasinopilosus TaxID=67344 RepID=UPI0006EBA91D|nr:hypothetical protein [Streptomyces prasinopilosus]
MATALIGPYDDAAADEVRLTDAVELFRKTGHDISKSTLERQSRARGVTLVKRRGANCASWSDLLEVHAAWVHSRDALP